MRILLTMNLPLVPAYGGANLSNRLLLEKLAARGHFVEAVVPFSEAGNHNSVEASLERRNIESKRELDCHRFTFNQVGVHGVTNPKALRSYLSCRIRERDYDVILVSTEDPSQSLLRTALDIALKKTLVLVHTPSLLPFGPLAFFPSEERTEWFHEVPEIVTVSKYTVQYVEKYSRTKARALPILFYGDPPFPTFTQFDRGYITLVNPCAIKGLSIFVSLAKGLPHLDFAAVPSWGTTPEDIALLQTCRNMTILPTTENPDDFYKSTRILVVPSLWGEARGRVVVEAILRGIPVIASAVGGIAEDDVRPSCLVEVNPITRFLDQLDGRLLPKPDLPEQNPDSWIRALQGLLSNREVFEETAQRGQCEAIKYVKRTDPAEFESFLSAFAGGTLKRSQGNQKKMEEGSSNSGKLTASQAAFVIGRLRRGPHAQRRHVPRVDRTRGQPVSYGQRQLWLESQRNRSSPQYNLGVAFELSGPLDCVALEGALNDIVCRHETLRTVYACEEGEVVQRLLLSWKVDLLIPDEVHDVACCKSSWQAVVSTFLNSPFDLGCGPVFKAMLIRTAKEVHILALNVHHIAADGRSVELLLQQLGSSYSNHIDGTAAAMEPSPFDYVDYAVFERTNPENRAALEASLDFWRNQLNSISPPMRKPPHSSADVVHGENEGAALSIVLEGDLWERAEALFTEHGASPFAGFLAVTKVLLNFYTGLDDILAGTPVTTRSGPDQQEVVGYFVNTVLLRSRLSGQSTFLEVLRSVQEAFLAAIQHQSVPYEMVVHEVAAELRNRSPDLFDVFFEYNAGRKREKLLLKGVRVKELPLRPNDYKFNLHFIVERTERVISLRYKRSHIADETAQDMVNRLRLVLEQLLHCPTAPLYRLSIYSPEEKHSLGLGNVTHQGKQCVGFVRRLLATATKWSNKTAVRWGETCVNYGELYAKASTLSRQLQKLGLLPGTLVMVQATSPIDLLSGMLASVLSGCGYVPLAGWSPEQVLSDPSMSAVQALITDWPCRFKNILVVDFATVSAQDLAFDANGADPIDPTVLYGIFTSGSTGDSKLAMVSASAFSHLIDWYAGQLKVTTDDVFLIPSSLGFDLTQKNLFAALQAGATLVFPTSTVFDPWNIRELFDKLRVTIINCAPSAFYHIADACEPRLANKAGLRWVVLGGETIQLQRLQGWLSFPGASYAFMNTYGPTECTDVVTSYTLPAGASPSDSVPIGRSIPRSWVVILNDNLQLCPRGVLGEIFVSGLSVGLGYANDVTRTASSFLPDPLSGIAGARMYKTGDLGTYLPNGDILYVTRSDYQVKLHGRRIELAGIETHLNQHPDVKQSVVVVQSVQGNERLAAFVQVNEDSEVGIDALRRWLAKRVPRFMIPSAFAILHDLPLNRNGKVDRTALPLTLLRTAEPQTQEADVHSPQEQLIKEAWESVLNCGVASDETNFFELGGDSISAVRLSSHLRTLLGIEMSVNFIFDHPLFRDFLQAVVALGHDKSSGKEERALKKTRPPWVVSHAQERLWFLQRLAPTNTSYHLWLSVRLEGTLDEQAVAKALNEIARRHGVLRASFLEENGLLKMKVGDGPVILQRGMLGSALRDIADIEIEPVLQELNRPFDLSQGPLFRVALLSDPGQQHYLIIVLHHIIADGWSARIFLKELSVLYGACTQGEESPLQQPSYQYWDYAQWQREELQGARIKELGDYWRLQLAGDLPILQLPFARPRPAVQCYRGDVVSFALNQETTAKLKRMAKDAGATLFMMLLATFKLALYRYSQQEDIIVGTPVSGRTRSELEGMIGLFVNTIAIRTKMSPRATFRELLTRVRETTLAAHTHQDMPFEKLVEELKPQRSTSHSPVFQVMFAFQNLPETALQFPGVKATTLLVNSRTVQFDLDVTIVDTSGPTRGTVAFNTALFESGQIEEFIGRWKLLIEAALASPETPLSSLPMMAEDEYRAIMEFSNPTGQCSYPGGSVHSRFEAQAGIAPDRVALAGGDWHWSYRDLNEKANAVARTLRQRGVTRQDMVCVCTRDVKALIAALLGILKAGAIYVPIDPDWPDERRDFVVQDSRARLLVGDDRLPARGMEFLSTTELLIGPLGLPATVDPDVPTSCLSPCYVIYTSGSTGRPKGVVISHGGLLNVIQQQILDFDVSQESRILQLASCAFDASISEIFTALLSGGTLCIPPAAARSSGRALMECLREQSISVATFVPSFARELPMQELPSLKTYVSAGEACTSELVDSWGSDRVFLNAYGPSESSICATVNRVVVSSEADNIGKPIANTMIYVLGRHGEPVPTEIPGEIYIGGVGLAICYLNNPELTAERFLPNPFSPGQRLYRTGDLGIWRRDGSLRYIGRADSQIKLHGIRIELGEVEAVIREHPYVHDVAVVCVTTRLGSAILAYVAPMPDMECDPETTRQLLQEHIRRKLPQYMVPSQINILSALPKTASGKVDRSALVQRDFRPRQSDYVPPRSETELLLTRIWQELLQVDRVGVHDNFFDLGGHSLLAMRALSQIREQFHADIPLSLLFMGDPTVSALANAINEYIIEHADPDELLRSVALVTNPLGADDATAQ